MDRYSFYLLGKFLPVSLGICVVDINRRGKYHTALAILAKFRCSRL